jgi:hypothetical protein
MIIMVIKPVPRFRNGRQNPRSCAHRKDDRDQSRPKEVDARADVEVPGRDGAESDELAMREVDQPDGAEYQ